MVSVLILCILVVCLVFTSVGFTFAAQMACSVFGFSHAIWQRYAFLFLWELNEDRVSSCHLVAFVVPDISVFHVRRSSGLQRFRFVSLTRVTIRCSLLAYVHI